MLIKEDRAFNAWFWVLGEPFTSTAMWGEMFEPLRDPEYFQRFEVHADLNTLTWPNGADLAPEYLYRAIAA